MPSLPLHSRSAPARSPSRLKAILGLLALAALGLLSLVAGCLNIGPIRIGYSGPITGRWADMGVQGRNGATLAVEDLNARGGVAGRRLELVVADEKDGPEGAQAAARFLEAKGVAVVVGFMTSTAALAGLPVAAEAGLCVVSPSASTTRLTGLEDAFFRVIPDVAAYARFQAEGMIKRHPGCRVLVVHDQGNAAFAEPYAVAFAKRLVELGGTMAGAVALVPGQMPDGPALWARVRAADAGAVLGLLPARTLARLAQEMRSNAPGLPIFAAMWGFNAEFLEMAGPSAEGVASCLIYPFSSASPPLAAFNARYHERFGYVASSGALLAYEATLAAAQGLELTGGRRAGLEKALAGLKKIPGICGDIALDSFGDVLRPLYWAEVRGGSIHAFEERHD